MRRLSSKMRENPILVSVEDHKPESFFKIQVIYLWHLKLLLQSRKHSGESKGL